MIQPELVQSLHDYGFYLGPEAKEVRCPDPLCMDDPDEEIMVKLGETCWSCEGFMPMRPNIQEFPCLNPECRTCLDVVTLAKRAAKLQKRAQISGGEARPVICTACSYQAWPDIHPSLEAFISPTNRQLPLAIREVANDPMNGAFIIVIALLQASNEKVYKRAEWDDLLDSLKRGVIAKPTLMEWITKGWSNIGALLNLGGNPSTSTPAPQPVRQEIHQIPTQTPTPQPKPEPVEVKPMKPAPSPPKKYNFIQQWQGKVLDADIVKGLLAEAGSTKEGLLILAYDKIEVVYKQFTSATNNLGLVRKVWSEFVMGTSRRRDDARNALANEFLIFRA